MRLTAVHCVSAREANADLRCAPHPPAFIPKPPYFFSAGLLKSTLGALEISRSFSTVKFGFVL